jgi:hypothetical protein
VSEWSKQYEQEWTIGPKERLLYELAKEYHETCEAYDRTVCSGPIGPDGAMPASYAERGLINRNAKKVRDAIAKRAEDAQLGITRAELQDAIVRYEKRS